MNNTTYSTKLKDLEPKWHFFDATNQVCGRFAVKVANILAGKNKPIFTPNMQTGDKVVVTNVEKIKYTGQKLEDKAYYWHTGFPKGLRSAKLESLLKKDSLKVFRKSVEGMLPKNKMKKQRIANLYVYKGSEHPHGAQLNRKAEKTNA